MPFILRIKTLKHSIVFSRNHSRCQKSLANQPLASHPATSCWRHAHGSGRLAAAGICQSHRQLLTVTPATCRRRMSHRAALSARSSPDWSSSPFLGQWSTSAVWWPVGSYWDLCNVQREHVYRLPTDSIWGERGTHCVSSTRVNRHEWPGGQR